MIETSVAAGDVDRAAPFWEAFGEQHFAREPFEVDDAPVDFAVDACVLFDALVRACEERRSGPTDPYVKVWLGGQQVIADPEPYLPRRGDGSLEGYRARVEASLDGADWAVVVGRIQAVSRRVWKNAAGFVLALSETTGNVPGYAHVAAIVGRYQSSGRGVHQDPYGVFVSAVDGSKEMVVWPPDADVPTESRSYAEVGGDARRLACGRGRLAYWPAGYWHVGESPLPSATMHLCVLERPPGLTELAELCTRRLGEGVEGSGLEWGATVHEIGFPAQYEAALQGLIGLIEDRSALKDRLVADWLRTRTGFGFAALPPTCPVVEPDASDVVERDGVGSIVLAPRDETTSWCAADGRVARVRSAPVLTRLVERLNRGDRVLVADALAVANTDVERRLVLGTLKLLGGWRAVRVDPVEQ